LGDHPPGEAESEGLFAKKLDLKLRT